MNKQKFTPGPWRIGNHSCIVECGSKDDTPATYQKIEVQHLLFVPGETERAKANARLISHAPEMYNYLKSVSATISNLLDSNYAPLPCGLAALPLHINELLNEIDSDE